MDDSAGMKFGNGVANLPQKAYNFPVSSRQIARSKELHHKIEKSVCLAVFVELRERSRLQLRKQTRFAHEACPCARLVADKHLYGGGGSKRNMHRAIHFAAPAFADERRNAPVAEHSTLLKRRARRHSIMGGEDSCYLVHAKAHIFPAFSRSATIF